MADVSVKLAGAARRPHPRDHAERRRRRGLPKAHFAAEFADRDTELGPLLERTARGELIGTVANRTLLHLHLTDGDTRVVELLWLELHGAWRIHDARVFSLLPGE